MASRVAELFMSEIVANCTHGIDLHTGALHRSNLPHIRANLDDADTMQLARAFGVPVLLNSVLRDGSLREAAAENGIPTLLYEAGEALRFDEIGIRAGVRGILNIMRALGMLRSKTARTRPAEPYIARSSFWVRAPESGILRALTSLGQRVTRGTVLGVISDTFGETEVEVTAAFGGIVIGRTNLPLVHQGEALFHVARFEDVKRAAEQVDTFQAEHAEASYLPTEPPIV